MGIDSRRRVGLALENLEVRDLEGMAWHSLQLMIEQQPTGNALASLIREVLGGLPSCSKSAAKSRLQLAQQALDHHGCKLPVSFLPEVVQLMLAYIQLPLMEGLDYRML
ncbi:hypothetical protein DUNSADRAFT_12090 [Dunaliella salina]|uniref:Uncharacterized protein n=1 Tax=Dunaliella salina TaxID=3046 RepID=A0ABQ7H452_DUNSA|nr:hypothetical protein DUNSADRAFT_12090 [Dunaliella salina]|eukprot:KAF5841634.1 hypothetical protein DUNSADRAFT_12090 [Dunaliella salina]